MDLNKFFGFYNKKNSTNEEDLDENLETYKKTPRFKIGMFSKLIHNGLLFKKQIITFFSSSSEAFDIDDISVAGEFMMHNRAWYWISQFDWDDEYWVSDLKDLSNEELMVALLLSVKYFEEQEEYEKCAFLKKILDFVKENLEN